MTQAKTGRQEDGFSLIEVMIAIAIMSIGILAVVASFATAVAHTQYGQENLIARQKAMEAMESIFAARNTQQVSFAQLANVASGGIFSNVATTLRCAGTDGLVNTTDDTNCPANGPCPAGVECVVMPGPDGVLGTADDVGMSLGNFTRQVQINTVLEADGVTIDPNLKQVVVTVTYKVNGSTRTYVAQGLISAFR